MSRGQRGATFSSMTPHFYKIILEETLREKRLLIPKKFVRLYGHNLSNSVSVKLPSCGSEWKMEVTKHEGQVWLGKGWAKFAEHYSIVRGHMLYFRYEGNSSFEAVIFDTSTVEIDYPCKRKISEDNSVENLDDFPAQPRTRKKSQSPCSRPRKRMRTSPIAEPQINLSHLEPKGSRHNKTVLLKSERKGDSPSSSSEMEGKQDLPSSSVDRKSSPTSRKISEIFKSVKPLDRGEKAAALEKASCFASHHPFFKVVMQPSYVNGLVLNFPATFARKYLKNKSRNVVLKVPNGKKTTWPVKQKLVFCGRNWKAIIYCGWIEFARSNNLEVGDVCVFVLLKGIEVTFEVVIFRANGNSKSPNSSAFNVGATQVDRCEKSSANESEPGVAIENGTNAPCFCDDLPAKQDKRSVSSCHKTSLELDAIGQQQSLSSAEKARLLKRAHFVSDKPFFKVIIQPSYTSVRSHMPIPLDIAQRYFKKEGDVILRVPNRGSWSVQLKSWRLKTGQLLAEFQGGWKVFVVGNNLKVGDVCIFQLVDGNKTSFEVHIVRVPEDDAYHQRSQDETSTPCSLRKTSPKQVATKRQKALTLFEKTKFLERARFESRKPFFKIVVQPSYTGVGHHMPLSYNFAQKYMLKDGVAILHVQHRTRSWPAQFKRRCLKSGRLTAEISNGWKEFAEGNNLKLGDVCVFELTNVTDISFDVSIIRAALDDACQQRCLDGDSELFGQVEGKRESKNRGRLKFCEEEEFWLP